MEPGTDDSTEPGTDGGVEPGTDDGVEPGTDDSMELGKPICSGRGLTGRGKNRSFVMVVEYNFFCK